MHDEVRSKKVCEDSQAICKTSVANDLQGHDLKLRESVVTNQMMNCKTLISMPSCHLVSPDNVNEYIISFFSF